MNATTRLLKGITMVLFLSVMVISAQVKDSKGDQLFYGYAYKDAIIEYQKEMAKGILSNGQMLNLADAYFQTGSFDNASKIYLDIHKKDSIMTNHQFNKMLQSLSKTSSTDRVLAFLNTKKPSLSNEFVENAEFNLSLLNTKQNDIDKGLSIFNIKANSPQSDISPTFYGERLLFSSGRAQPSKNEYQPSGESYLDIYVGRINTGGNVVSVNPFTGIPASKFHKATPYFAASLGSIFYIQSNVTNDELAFDPNNKNALALGMVDKSGSFNFLLRDLSTSFYYPFYEEATGKLYFAANFEDGYGGTDLYFVYTNNGQIMSGPKNLGPRVNSPANEIAPYIFDNSLFFSSDVFYGLGGMDIYKSNIHNDETYSIPTNLGKGINSEKDDFGFIIKNEGSEGFTGYFSSNRVGGSGSDDIYGFNVTSIPGLKTFVLRGKVANFNSDNGIENATVNILDENKNPIETVMTNGQGMYQLEIPWRDTIMVTASKIKYSNFIRKLVKTNMDSLRNQSFQIELALLDDIVVEREAFPVIKLNDFFFAEGSSELTPAIEGEMDKVVQSVQQFPEMKLRIESHTDSRGSSEKNRKVSQLRSDVLKNYLLKHGVSKDNIVGAIGYGEDRILNNCTDGVYCIEFLHKKNLRSLIVVTNYDQLK